jgi:hypothetical protein
VSEWCDGAGGSVVSGAGDAVSKREDGAGRAAVPAGDDSVSEWCGGARGSVVSGAACDGEMLGRQHRPKPLEMPSANTFLAACAIPFTKFLGRIGLKR